VTETRDIARPAPGFWRIRLIKDGPFVAAAIVRHHTTYEPGNVLNAMDRSPILTGYIDGEMCDPMKVWLRYGDPIDEREYQFLIRDSAWAKQNFPSDPKAAPRRAVDFSTLQIRF